MADSATSTIKTVLPKGSIMGAAGAVLNLYSGVNEYKEARQQGQSKLTSVAKAVGSFAFYEMLGLWAIPYTIATTVPSLMMASGKHTADTISKGYDQRGKLGSGYFNMSEAGYTMRQRSLNAIHNNGLNLNSALGNEARTYFRGSV